MLGGKKLSIVLIILFVSVFIVSGCVDQMQYDDLKAEKAKQSIPGIGKFFSLLVVSEIDDIDRFSSAAKLHAYAGLVPSTYSSGGRTYHGRIIKQGNKYLRYAMIEAVWPALNKCVDLEKVYNRIYHRRGANSAKVAAARRLLTIVYRVLKEHREYRYRY